MSITRMRNTGESVLVNHHRKGRENESEKQEFELIYKDVANPQSVKAEIGDVIKVFNQIIKKAKMEVDGRKLEKDKSLDTILKNPKWKYLAPLKRLKVLYREMRLPKHRLRKNGNERKKDGSLSKNQYRMGPLTLEARIYFLSEILKIQSEVNLKAIEIGMPKIDILNDEEIFRIRELIEAKTFPNKWSGEELNASIPQDEIMYSDGTIMQTLFKQST